ncbi:hypothetical protein TWF730_010741 [Orbilia blumenaviensis]|uniref:Uncharacterized protein n=1 Tax=Orbilia blumenaviensis TaxID=1796055 RepID=A0AAV9USI9_9PEZI
MSSVAPDTRRSISSENGIDAPRSPSRAANPEYVSPASLSGRKAAPSQQCYRGSDSGLTSTSAEQKPAPEFFEGRLPSVDPRPSQPFRGCPTWVEESLKDRNKRVSETLKPFGGPFPKGGPYAKEIDIEDDGYSDASFYGNGTGSQPSYPHAKQHSNVYHQSF